MPTRAECSLDAPPPRPAATEIPLLPTPQIIAAMQAGDRLTTPQVIARMGLLATPLLVQRVAAALRDHGFVRIAAPSPTGSVKIWIPAPADPITTDPVTDRFRRIHEEGDRVRGCAYPRPRLDLFGRASALWTTMFGGRS